MADNADGELDNDLHMAIKQLFIDGIAWGRNNPYGTLVPPPSEVEGIKKVRALLANHDLALLSRIKEARVDEHNLVFTKSGELGDGDFAEWSLERLTELGVDNEID